MATPTLDPKSLPSDLQAKLLPNEDVHHFGFIDAKSGGCASGTTAKQWLLITSQRIVFEAAVKEGSASNAKFVHQSGSIPIGKVSYVGTSSVDTPKGCGCSNVTVHNLRINSSGGEIVLAIPTKAEVDRAQAVIDAIISAR